MPSLSVVVVTHDSRDAIAATLPALAAQLRDGDELIVVDNASADGTPALAGELAPAALVSRRAPTSASPPPATPAPRRRPVSCSSCLNPDAVPDPDWRDAIERPLVEGRGWSAWQALVTAEGGRAVNTRGGVVHFTGIAWAGDAGTPIDALPASEPIALEDPGFVSGACLAILRATYLEAGGMPAEFFLYHEDVDLSLRLRLGGGVLGVEPAARVDHDYEFDKGKGKWRHLERNRWATLIRTYPGALLALLVPGLLATELALIPVSIAGGWFGQKLLAWADFWRSLPRLLGERRAIQRGRTVSARAFADTLTPDLDSPYLGAAASSGALRALLRGYWSVVRALLPG